MLMRRWLAALTCCGALLTACGGGSTTAPTYSPAPTTLVDTPADAGTDATTTAGSNDTGDSGSSDTTRASNVPDIDVCTLVTATEAATIMGEIKEGPKKKTGLMDEPQCEYINLAGEWVTFSLYGADRWEAKQGELSASNMERLSGLGDEAFSAKRGTDSEVYVLKGGAILEVRGSGGMEMSMAIAQQALGRL